ncbi:hypothetical protein M0R45_019987 [Rubus argutus]|uniref:Uncharacterized protein n=1 Tax=Rubus argutus TaxID=59490 RepID=A0AAW1X7J5_RUBAR
MMIRPQYDLMNGSFSWLIVHKLKEVIRNAEQWIEKSCMEYQVGQIVIKFSLSFLNEAHELKFTLVKQKLMELISVFEIASDSEEQGTQYTKSYSGVDQSMKLGSHFEKWYQSNTTIPFGSQCVLVNKAVVEIVAFGVIILGKQEESTWVCLLLLVYISLEKHVDMLCTISCSGVDQSMKLGSHFEKWYQSNITTLFGSQCVLVNKAAATIVTYGVIALAKQKESTWVYLLLLVYISLEKHLDMLYFKGCGLLGSYFHVTLYWTSYCRATYVYLLAQSVFETHPITKAFYAEFW